MNENTQSYSIFLEIYKEKKILKAKLKWFQVTYLISFLVFSIIKYRNNNHWFECWDKETQSIATTYSFCLCLLSSTWASSVLEKFLRLKNYQTMIAILIEFTRYKWTITSIFFEFTARKRIWLVYQ